MKSKLTILNIYLTIVIITTIYIFLSLEKGLYEEEVYDSKINLQSSSSGSFGDIKLLKQKKIIEMNLQQLQDNMQMKLCFLSMI